ncbi:MAG: DNA-binding protein [Actinobacteria bacterium]|nr:DNA-binding protein [Actinomycetota bacterium]
MNASPADQRLLLEVAALDLRIRQADIARRNPPQAARVQELLARRQVLAQELGTRLGRRDDLRAELKRIESDVAMVDARRQRDTDRLQTVSNPKDAVGLESELVSLARRKSELEDGELEVMERLEQADTAVAEQEAVIAATNAEGSALSGEAKAIVAEATARFDAASRDRAALAEPLPADLLALYEKLAAHSSGAALLQHSMCQGCRMMLSGNDLQNIRQTAVEVVVVCPQCDCILVRTDESGL